eukprot:1675849-Rhodomonas_salina.2
MSQHEQQQKTANSILKRHANTQSAGTNLEGEGDFQGTEGDLERGPQPAHLDSDRRTIALRQWTIGIVPDQEHDFAAPRRRVLIFENVDQLSGQRDGRVRARDGHLQRLPATARYEAARLQRDPA